MFSVAIIGPDGAGKTTIARRLEQNSDLPVTYLYMGINIESSNVALPTSRLIEWAKNKRRKKSRRAGSVRPAGTSLHHRSSDNHQPAGRLWACVRLLNRLAEEWYRQYLSWQHRRNGRIVIYDRHFKFDFENDDAAKHQERMRLTDRLHRWLLAHAYPAPELVIYLDAPAEVLFARKGEATIEYLEARRQAFLRQGKATPNFVIVDATQPLAEVYAQVAGHLTAFYRKRKNGRRD